MQQMIAAADQRLHVLANHTVNNRRLVETQFTAVTRSRAAACYLLIICRRNQYLVITMSVEHLKFVSHPCLKVKARVKVKKGISSL